MFVVHRPNFTGMILGWSPFKCVQINQFHAVFWVSTVCKTTLLGVSSIQKVNSALSDEFKQSMPLGTKVACPKGHMFYLGYIEKA